jgi:hypothetical protein
LKWIFNVLKRRVLLIPAVEKFKQLEFDFISVGRHHFFFSNSCHHPTNTNHFQILTTSVVWSFLIVRTVVVVLLPRVCVWLRRRVHVRVCECCGVPSERACVSACVPTDRTVVSRGRWKDKWNNMRLIRQGRTRQSACVRARECVCGAGEEDGGVLKIKSYTILRWLAWLAFCVDFF